MRWWCFSVLVVCGFSCSFSVSLEDESALPPTVAFEFTMSGADEMSGTIMIPVILSRPAEEEITVNYSLLNGNNATPGVDFDLTTGTLVFAVGEYRRELPVIIKSDTDETEAVETFDIALSAPHGATLDEVRAIHSVRIADHILPRVTVGPASTATLESAPTNLVIKLDKPSEGQSTVVVGVSGGAPAPANNNDITLVDGTQIVIPDGATSVNVPIGEKDDALDEEDNEIVVFTLRGASPNLVIGTTKSINHAIGDNDMPPQVRFNQATANVGEGNLGETVTVSLSAVSGRQVKVDYIRDGNDTADGNDATVFGSPSTITFNAGDMSKTIVISVANDNLDEDDENVIVNLSNAVNATLGTATHTLTIQDNDTAAASFMASTSTVDEDPAGGIDITVRLSNPSVKQVSVPFSVNGGMTSADSGDFQILTGSPLVFAPGVTQLNITVDVFDNPPGNESDERVVLDLGTPTNAQLQNPTRHTLTIKE